LYFEYDETGKPLRMEYGGGYYYYLYNAQGDVTGLLDSTGVQVVNYVYDTWGVCTSVTGTLAGTVGAANPFRYRGYYWDSETGLFYLGSRYYDAVGGRWINADGQLNQMEGFTGMNLFQYCGNNPVNRIDPTGEAWWHWAIGAAIVVGCAVAVVATCGGAAAAIGAVAAVASGSAAATTGATIAAGAFIGASMALGTSAMIAASNSKSVSDFNAQGNWGTVASTAGGAILGGASAAISTKSSSSSKSSKLDKYVSNPQKIKNVEPIKIQKIAIKENLNFGTLSKGSHAGQGLKVTWGGDRLLQYHPGGGHHGPNPYWKVSSGETGTIRIFNDK
jgi:RHS repeat-associated protein